METGNFENTSILLDILNEIKDESEIKSKIGDSLIFSDVDSDDRMRRQRYIAYKKFPGEVNRASGILTVFFISEDIELWYSYRLYSH